MSVIVCYAPTETSDDAAKDQFYDDLSVTVNHTSRHDVTIVMGDLNAVIGSDRVARRGIICPVCSGFANDNGSRLLDFCASNDLRVGSSWFPRKRINQLTWYSHDGVTRKFLDHVIISRRWFSCMTSCRVFKSAELGSSDHRLFAFSLRLRTKACKQTTPTKRYNTDALNNHTIASKYAVEVHNRYALLQDLDPGDQNIDDAWETFKCAIHETASKILGKPHVKKKTWISEPTLNIIEDRRAARLRGDKPEVKRLARERNRALGLVQGSYWDAKAAAI